ncbi:MAG TPA: tetratricopeptide repeat protein, partial [Flavobacteriales bacterium]|nr:tetratricopeptide repeat protein [Flavobacteriales bacterium]
EAELNALDEKAQRKRINELSKQFVQGDIINYKKFLDFALRWGQLKDYSKGYLASVYLKRSKYYSQQRKVSLAMSDLLKAEDYYLATKDIVGLEEVCLTFANLYFQVNDNVKAIKFALKAKEYAEQLKNDETSANVYNTLANLYKAQGQIENAILYYNKSLALFRKNKNKEQEALLLDNISMVLWDGDGRESMIDTAWYYNQEAIKIAKQLKDRFLELQLLANASAISEKKGEFDKQLFYAMESKHISDSMNIEVYSLYSDLNYGAALNNNNRSNEAIPIFRNCVKVLKAQADYYALATAYFEISRGFEKLRRFDSALVYYKLHKETEDTLSHIRGKDKVNEVLAKVELDQKEEKIASLKNLNKALKEKEVLNAEKDRLKSIMLYGAIVLLLVIAILLVITFKRFKDNKKLSAEIILKNNALVTKNNEITDSINYAKRIQEALLPAGDELARSFADSFILYKPKDIVSGDFYWIHKENERLFFA